MQKFHISLIFFLSGLPLSDTDDSQDSKERDVSIFIPLCHFRLLTNIQAFIYICTFKMYVHLLFLIALRAITTLLLDNMIPPPDFMSDFITAYQHFSTDKQWI